MTRIISTLFLLVSLMATPCFAQTQSDNTEIEFDTNKPPMIEAAVKTSYAGFGEVDGISTDMAVLKTDIDLELPLIEFSYSRRDFSWKNAGNLNLIKNDTDPYNDLHLVSAQLGGTHMLDNDMWGVFGYAQGAMAFEKEITNSYQGSLSLGAVYKYSNDLTFALGAIYQYDQIDHNILPVFGIRYRRFARDGLCARIAVPSSFVRYWLIDDDLAVQLGWSMENSVYRLKDNSAYYRKGYIKNEDMNFSLGLKYEPVEHIDMNAGVQYFFGRQYTLYNEKGQREYKMDVDGAFGFFVSLDYAF